MGIDIAFFATSPALRRLWAMLFAGRTVAVVKPEHALFTYLTEKDCTYHLHGWYEVPEGAEVLVVDRVEAAR